LDGAVVTPRLDGKVGIVTGAASGIGRATSAVFTTEGARVMLADLNAAGLDESKSLLGDPGGARTCAADLSDEQQVRLLVEETVREFGRIDYLVNCHGRTEVPDVKIADVPIEVFDRTIAVNVRSIFLTCKHVIPAMVAEGGGSIVNLASTAALVGWGGAAYTAAKGAVAALSRHIAHQYADDGIRCNTILPGIVRTPMLEVFTSKSGMAPAPSLNGTIGRMAEPEEVGHLAAYLTSDVAGFVTGATYTLDGGVTRH
jgi:NAD(P)-dependent dehydrogenase (short-subunit alcohol dehydrogenase family)